MEEIRVNEYVRTKQGKITQVKTIYSGKRKYTVTEETLINGKIKISDVTKHSEFIWELIEKGDYVNGHKVEEIWENGFSFGGCDYMFQVTGYEIKSIVTKEMYKSIEYKVGD